MSKTFRSKELNNKYLSLIAEGYHNDVCRLCSAPALKEWGHWKLIDNPFPYDLIASEHHMTIPKRHIDEDGLNIDEQAELKLLKQDYINENYGWLMEAVNKRKSIPAHFHLHLINSKFNYE